MRANTKRPTATALNPSPKLTKTATMKQIEIITDAIIVSCILLSIGTIDIQDRQIVNFIKTIVGIFVFSFYVTFRKAFST